MDWRATTLLRCALARSVSHVCIKKSEWQNWCVARGILNTGWVGPQHKSKASQFRESLSAAMGRLAASRSAWDHRSIELRGVIFNSDQNSLKSAFKSDHFSDTNWGMDRNQRPIAVDFNIFLNRNYNF
jgi:hypothetical protein